MNEHYDAVKRSRELDGLCDQFEAAWIAGSPPELDAFIDTVDESLREPLLDEILPLDFSYRSKQQPTLCDAYYRELLATRVPSLDAVLSRHPEIRHVRNPNDLLFALAAANAGLIRRVDVDLLAADRLQLESLRSRSGIEQSMKSTVGAQELNDTVQSLVSQCGGDLEKALGYLLCRVQPDQSSASPVDKSSRRSKPFAGDTVGQDKAILLKRELNRGGMGQLFIGEDTHLRRDVAVKFILSAEASPERVKRHIREGKITASLIHPAIPPVHSLCEEGSHGPWYEMLYLDKDRFSDLRQASDAFHASAFSSIDFHSKPFRDLISRFATACRSIAFAHENRIIHRDLKPEHITFGEFGETLVIDWGLAKRLDAPDEDEMLVDDRRVCNEVLSATHADAAKTIDGRALGTPGFMAPEQAEGNHSTTGPAADVFGLGATLYYLLTKQPPSNDTREPSSNTFVKGTIRSPRSIQSKVPKPLEAICLKALSSDPQDRYAGSAKALAEDLDSWLADEPVTAWKEPLHVQASRWVRKHKAIVTSGTVALLATVIILAVSRSRINQARQRAEASFAQAKDTIDDWFTTFADSPVINATGMAPLKNELLSKAEDHYMLVKKDVSDESEPTFAVDQAKVEYQLGTIKKNVGQSDSAQQHYNECIRICLIDIADPNVRQQLLKYQSLSENALGLLAHGRGDIDAAIKHFIAAKEIREALYKLAPDDENVRLHANSVMNLAEYHFQQYLRDKSRESWETALAEQKEAHELREPLLASRLNSESSKTRVDAQRDEANSVYDLARLYNTKGLLSNQSDAFKEAGKLLLEAIKQYDSVIKLERNPTSEECRFLRSHAHLLTANNLRQMARHEGNSTTNSNQKIEDYFLLAFNELRELSEKQPAMPAYRIGQATVLRDWAYRNFDTVPDDEIERTCATRLNLYNSALELLRTVLANDSENAEAIGIKIDCLQEWAITQVARALTQQSIEEIEGLSELSRAALEDAVKTREEHPSLEQTAIERWEASEGQIRKKLEELRLKVEQLRQANTPNVTNSRPVESIRHRSFSWLRLLKVPVEQQTKLTVEHAIV